MLFRSSLAQLGLQLQTIKDSVDESRKELTKLKNDYDDLKKSVTDLQNSPGRTTLRTADSPPNNQIESKKPDFVKPAGKSGRIQLTNNLDQILTIRINDAYYRLEPKDIRLTEPITAGLFSYQVVGLKDSYSRLLEADKVYKLEFYR